MRVRIERYGGVIGKAAAGERDVAELVLLARERVTVLNQTPSAFGQLIRADGEAQRSLSLRLVIFGGEALNFAELRPKRWNQGGLPIGMSATLTALPCWSTCTASPRRRCT